MYEGAPETSCAWQTSRHAVVANSFSKYFAMTGWRLGWLLVPQELQRTVDCLTGNFTICPPVLAQIAAVAAFSPESIAEADALLLHYGANRRLLLDGLRSIGIDRLAPTDGAFYVYADVSRLTTDSLSFCSKLLNDTGVAIAADKMAAVARRLNLVTSTPFQVDQFNLAVPFARGKVRAHQADRRQAHPFN